MTTTDLPLLLLGQEADPHAERGVQCLGELPAPPDPGMTERAQAARAALGDRVLVLGHHDQRDEVIASADIPTSEDQQGVLPDLAAGCSMTDMARLPASPAALAAAANA